MNYKYWNKIYNLPHGSMRFSFKYLADVLGDFKFNLEVVEMGEVESGYEDDDLLTFSPSVMRVGFIDYERYNYEYMKQVLGQYPFYEVQDVTNFEFYWTPKGESERIEFAGYIDKNSLNYDADRKIFSFDVISFAKMLKDITVSDLLDTQWESFIYVLSRIYEKVYPNFTNEAQVTNDINIFKQGYFKGIFLKHNWIYRGQFGATQNFGDPSNYNKIAFLWKGMYWKCGQNADEFPFDTWADALKQMCVDFAVTIGTEQPNKVYCVKRFVKASSVVAEAIDITDRIVGGYSKELWLKNIICTVNNNYATGWRVTYGYDRQNPNRPNIPANKETHYEINTRFGCYQNINNLSYATVRVRSNVVNSGWEDVYSGCTDTDIMQSNQAYLFQHLVCALYQASREIPHDKYEFLFYGLNYSMADYYKHHPSGTPLKVLRPLVLKKNYITNRTQVTALEIGINR